MGKIWKNHGKPREKRVNMRENGGNMGRTLGTTWGDGGERGGQSEVFLVEHAVISGFSKKLGVSSPCSP